MSRTKFADLNIDEQITLLHKGLSQLQDRFGDHDHSRDGGVRIGLYNNEVDLKAVYDEGD